MTSATDHSQAIHEFLLSPEAYPEKPSKVELKETHISWVYLTDRYVYKQKKPVKFEFLDFSSLELRKQFCDQELALNRRFSPEVYLSVVPVSLTTQGFRLKRGADVAEWLVKMTRLDEATTLENLISNDQLTPKHVERLSNSLKDFYTAQAPAMLRSNDFLQGLRQHILANRNDLLIVMRQSEAIIQFVTNAQLRCLTLEFDAFIHRVADGRVVDGHGDLRPEHIYYRRGRPVIIDCIEFSQEYRTNDVIDELAFLSMECDRLGNQDVGRAVESAYRVASSDDAKPFLANFYKCYRACVRAKVAALRSSQSSREGQAEAQHLAQEYLHLAKNYAEQMGPKIVFLVGGLSGSGKSTLASSLRDSLSAELLQTDVIRSEVFRPGSPNGKYTAAGRQRVYDDMTERIEDALQRSPTLVLDGTFNSNSARVQVAHKASAAGALVVQVECQCPHEVAKNRIAKRQREQNDASEATPDLLSVQSKERERPLGDQPVLNIDTTQDLADQVEEVVGFARSISKTIGNSNV